MLFRASDVVVTGDVMDTTRFPVIDVANGGSIQGEIDALNKLIELTIAPTPFIYKDVGTYVIPGHGRLCEQMEVVDYRDMVVLVRDIVADLMKQGKTLDQIKAARPALPYETRYGAQTGTTERVHRGHLQEPAGERSHEEAVVVWWSRVLATQTDAFAQSRGGRGGAPAPPQTPKAAAPIDVTGYWVSVVTEDWRYRMVTPAKGDYQGVPMTPEARKIADAWDPAKEEASGELCKSYGAPAILRVPGRLHITWQDDQTLRLDTDAGKQTRIFHFGGWKAARPAPHTIQGDSVGGVGRRRPRRHRRRDESRRRRTSRPASCARTACRTARTRRVTEYYELITQPDGSPLMVVTISRPIRYICGSRSSSARSSRKKPSDAKWKSDGMLGHLVGSS